MANVYDADKQERIRIHRAKWEAKQAEKRDGIVERAKEHSQLNGHRTMQESERLESERLESKLIKCMCTVDRLAVMVADYDGPFDVCGRKGEVSDSDRWGTIALNADLLCCRLGRLVKAIQTKRQKDEDIF